MATYDGFWFSELPSLQVLQQSTTPGTTSSSCGGGYSTVSSPTESGGTACLSSPSSGYSSSDEGRATPVDAGGGWTDCLLSSGGDPYLGDLVMTPTASHRDAAAAAVMSSSWGSGTSLVLDDFMDTLWDSLSTSPRPADTGSLIQPAALTSLDFHTLFVPLV